MFGLGAHHFAKIFMFVQGDTTTNAHKHNVWERLIKETFLHGRATKQRIIGSNKNGIFAVKSNYLYLYIKFLHSRMHAEALDKVWISWAMASITWSPTR
jgi:hypothetical protein